MEIKNSLVRRKGVIDINTIKNKDTHAAEIAETIWLEHEAKIKKFCSIRLTGYYHESLDDCMQEIFIGLLEYVKRGAPMDNPRALLYEIAKGKVYDIIRRKNKEGKKVFYITDLYNSNELPDSYEIYSGQVDISEEVIEQVSSDIIAKLTPQEQELLKDIVGKKKLKIIADKQGVSVSKAWRSEKLLREKIKKLIEEQFNKETP